jgi:hypothetical protein
MSTPLALILSLQPLQLTYSLVTWLPVMCLCPDSLPTSPFCPSPSPVYLVSLTRRDGAGLPGESEAVGRRELWGPLEEGTRPGSELWIWRFMAALLDLLQGYHMLVPLCMF